MKQKFKQIGLKLKIINKNLRILCKCVIINMSRCVLVNIYFFLFTQASVNIYITIRKGEWLWQKMQRKKKKEFVLYGMYISLLRWKSHSDFWSAKNHRKPLRKCSYEWKMNRWMWRQRETAIFAGLLPSWWRNVMEKFRMLFPTIMEKQAALSSICTLISWITTVLRNFATSSIKKQKAFSQGCSPKHDQDLFWSCFIFSTNNVNKM